MLYQEPSLVTGDLREPDVEGALVTDELLKAVVGN
jgi:hypothetical protein